MFRIHGIQSECSFLNVLSDLDRYFPVLRCLRRRALIGLAQARSSLGSHRVLEWAVDMLRKLRHWPTSPAQARSAGAAPRPTSAPAGLATAFGVARDLVRLLANMCVPLALT